MDVRQLRNALAIIERGSIGKAAESLRISQPALTKSIRRLEDELQIKLFERNPRGMQPTIYAECLRAHAQAVSTELNQLRADLNALRAGSSGIVEIGAPPIVAPEVFPRAVAQLNRDCPDVLIRIATELSPQLIRSLQMGSFDFVVTFLASDIAPAGCVQRFLFNDQLMVAARAGHPVTRLRRVGARELAAYRWILPHKDNLHRQRLELAFEAEGVPFPHPVMECNSVLFLKAAIRETDCVTVVSRLAVKSEEKAGLLETIELDSRFMTRKIGLMWREDQKLSPASQKLKAIIEKQHRKAH